MGLYNVMAAPRLFRRSNTMTMLATKVLSSLLMLLLLPIHTAVAQFCSDSANAYQVSTRPPLVVTHCSRPLTRATLKIEREQRFDMMT